MRSLEKKKRGKSLEVLSNKIVFRYEFDAQRKGSYKVDTFEDEFASYCGAKFALGGLIRNCGFACFPGSHRHLARG